MPLLTPEQWQDAALGAFTTFWAARTPIAYPNLRFDPSLLASDDDAWVRAFILTRPGSQVPVGPSSLARPVHRFGIMTIEILVRENKGTALAYELGNDALVFFENQLVLETIFTDLGTSEVGGDPWWQLNAGATFMYLSDRAVA